MNSANDETHVEHGGALAAACAEFGGAPAEWLDLSTGINPNPLPLPEIDQWVWQRLPDDDLINRAGAAAAAYYGTADGIQPLPVAGTQSVIQMLPALFSGNVAIFGSTYEEYRYRFERTGRPVDVIADAADINDDHRLVVAINPNNPDGRILKRETIVEISDQLSDRGGYVIVDEAYADLHPDERVADLAGKITNLVVLRSFGKFFGLAGLRLGFVLGAPRIAQKIRAEQGPWAVSGPALALAAVILEDGAVSVAISEKIAERRKSLGEVLKGAGLAIVGGTQLFALVEDDQASELHRQLCVRRILTRKFGHFPHWLRIGLGPDAAADDRLSAALADIKPCLS